MIGNALMGHQHIIETYYISHSFRKAKTIVNASVNIGKGVILSSASIVDHGATVDNYAHLAAGAMVQKGATVPDGIKVSSGTIY